MASALAATVNFFVSVFSYATGSYIAGTVIGYVVAGALIAGTTKVLLGKLIKLPEIGLGEQGAAILANGASSSAPLPVIYGARRVGGVRVFAGSSPGYIIDDSGNLTGEEIENEYLNLVIALGEGEIHRVQTVYANNVEIYPNPDAKFKGHIECNVHVGKDNQKADQLLIETAQSAAKPFIWTNAHQLNGVAYLYLKLKANPEIFTSGVPTFNADVLGTKVKDYRNTYAGTAVSIERYSNNPALCIRDYLENDRYGRGIPSSQIDNTSFNSAANYCDEKISIQTDTFTTLTQKRYTANGVVSVGESSLDTLEKLLTCCRGMLVFTGGVYKLVLDKAETPSLTFDESNVLPNFILSLPGKDTLSNRISANYFNPSREWQADFVYAQSEDFKIQDNNLFLERKIELPFTADYYMANYIAEQVLKQSRQGLVIDFKTTQEGLLTEVGDVIYIKLEAPGWSTLNNNAGKKFRVIQVGIESNDEISILAREYDSAVYTHGIFKTKDTAPNTALPQLSTVIAPATVNATETLLFNDPKITNRISLTWDQPLTSYVNKYEVTYKKGNDNLYVNEAITTGKQYNIDNLEPGLYIFLVRSVNTAGFKSDYIEKTFEVKGTTILPAVNPPGITGITESLVSTTKGSGIKAKAVVTWSASQNTDWENLGVYIDSYEVERKLSTTSNYERLGSSTGTFFEFFDITPGIYDFRIRAVNTANIKSNYVESTAEINGLSAKPANVANFFIRAESTQANLSWTPATDLDVKVGGTFEIRHSVATSNATWPQAIKIGSDIPGSSNSASMPLLVGTYLIKAVDSTGNKSDSAKAVINTISPSTFDVFEKSSITDTAFAGTKTDMVVDDAGFLKFEADVTWDNVAGNIDTWGLVDSIGGVDSPGTYLFSSNIDLGSPGNATLKSEITFEVYSTTDIWDNFQGNIDTWDSIDSVVFDDVNATLYVATTQQDPASGSATWTDYQEFTIGNYYGRGFKFKLICTTGSNDHQIKVTSLKATAEVYYRLESETVTTNASGSSLTYDNAFLATPQIAISANNMSTGDYYAITNSTANGFTLRFYNAGGTGVARTAYYLSRGY